MYINIELWFSSSDRYILKILFFSFNNLIFGNGLFYNRKILFLNINIYMLLIYIMYVSFSRKVDMWCILNLIEEYLIYDFDCICRYMYIK